MLQLKIEINEEKELDTYLYFFSKTKNMSFVRQLAKLFQSYQLRTHVRHG